MRLDCATRPSWSAPRSGETSLVTLDGATRLLDSEDDADHRCRRAYRLAGIMGGASTEVGPESSDILLEAACGSPPESGAPAAGSG